MEIVYENNLNNYISTDRNTNRQKIQNIETVNSKIVKTKEDCRNDLKRKLIKKYMGKIIYCINLSITKNGNGKGNGTNEIINSVTNKCEFFYNYYDFLNKKMGHPHLIVNEIMYEMCYEHSKFVENNITLKNLYGPYFKWTLVGKNKIIFEW